MIKQIDAKVLADKLTEATNRVARDYFSDDVSGEEDFSSQLCGRLKEALHDFKTPGMIWQTDVVQGPVGAGRLRARSLNKQVEEPKWGADIVVVLDAQGQSYHVQKGFIAQAKLLKPGKRLPTVEYERLIGQCERMLSHTPSSMVLLYSTEKVHVVSAAAVISQRKQDLWSITTYSLEVLYYDFAICWFRDTRLRTTSKSGLAELREQIDARAALKLTGTGKDWADMGHFDEHVQ